MSALGHPPRRAASPATVTRDLLESVAEVALVLDDDVEEDLINLHHHYTPFRVLPTLLRDYDLQLDDGRGWRTVARVRDNRRRHPVHTLDTPVGIGAPRVVAMVTNGAPRAHVVSVRAYDSATQC